MEGRNETEREGERCGCEGAEEGRYGYAEREEEGKEEANLEDAEEVFRSAAELSRQHESVRLGGRGRRTRRRTLPQATLALSEYSEMATFSSTRWSAKLSGLSRPF
jgi:hypothetical protein